MRLILPSFAAAAVSGIVLKIRQDPPYTVCADKGGVIQSGGNNFQTPKIANTPIKVYCVPLQACAGNQGLYGKGDSAQSLCATGDGSAETNDMKQRCCFDAMKDDTPSCDVAMPPCVVGTVNNLEEYNIMTEEPSDITDAQKDAVIEDCPKANDDTKQNPEQKFGDKAADIIDADVPPAPAGGF